MATLYEAAVKGDLEALRAAIKRGEDVNQKAGKRLSTPLFEAASSGNIEAVKELISAGASADLGNKFSFTPLLIAAEKGHLEIIKTLLSAGATIDLADNDGQTPLMWALINCQIDITKELLSLGANFDQPNETGCTPLIWAAMMGHTEIVKILLSLGADTDPTDFEGNNALRAAKKSTTSNAEIISLLEPKPEFLPVLPEDWEVFKDKQTKKRMYKNVSDDTVSATPPPGNPLFEISTYPPITFYGLPQEKEFTSSGGQVDFDNGAMVIVPPSIVPLESTLKITLQPSIAPLYDFKLPRGISSAGPAYLISSEGCVGGDITLVLDHHVKVTTKEEADDLVFLQADAPPEKLKTFRFEEVKEGKWEFALGESKGKLTFTLPPSPKLLKIGFRGGVDRPMPKYSFRGDSPPPDTPPPDRNIYTVRVYQSHSQKAGDQLVIVCISLCGCLYEKFLDVFEKNTIPVKYPEISLDQKVVYQQVQFDQKERAKLKIAPPKEDSDKKEECKDENDYLVNTEYKPNVNGWSPTFAIKKTTKDDVDSPETGDYNMGDLHKYPETLVCRFSLEGPNVPNTTTATLNLIGVRPEIQIQVQLNKPDSELKQTPQQN